MKKIIASLLAALLVFSLAACSGGTAVTQFPQSSVTIKAGDSIVIAATAYTASGSKSPVTYTSRDTRIATVSRNGKIVGVKAGTTTIVARAATGKTDTLTVTVLKKNAKSVKVTSVSANVPKSIKVNQYREITGKVKPAKATGVKITYSSSRPGIASIDKSGLLLARARGETVITVKAGNKTAKYTVRVR